MYVILRNSDHSTGHSGAVVSSHCKKKVLGSFHLWNLDFLPQSTDIYDLAVLSSLFVFWVLGVSGTFSDPVTYVQSVFQTLDLLYS